MAFTFVGFQPTIAWLKLTGTACSVRWPINSVVTQRNIKVIAKGVANTCWTMQRLGGFWLVVQVFEGWMIYCNSELGTVLG